MYPTQCTSVQSFSLLSSFLLQYYCLWAYEKCFVLLHSPTPFSKKLAVIDVLHIHVHVHLYRTYMHVFTNSICAYLTSHWKTGCYLHKYETVVVSFDSRFLCRTLYWMVENWQHTSALYPPSLALQTTPQALHSGRRKGCELHTYLLFQLYTCTVTSQHIDFVCLGEKNMPHTYNYTCRCQFWQ